jgi:mannose-6-phosphate isomerase-like protein (cupin superfamily)
MVDPDQAEKSEREMDRFRRRNSPENKVKGRASIFLKKIEVVRGGLLKAGYSTPGIFREKAFESVHGYIIVSRTRALGRAMSGWHHHGRRHLYGFQVAGRMRLEYGPNHVDAVVVRPGDFFHIPPQLVHRDVNPDRNRKFVVVNILVGRGEPVINLEGLKAGSVSSGKRSGKPRPTARGPD